MKKSTDSYALITGAGRGLGLAFALECAHRGKSLILLDLDAERLRALHEHIDATYQVQIVTEVIDLTNLSQLENFVESLLASYEVTWLINNAGAGGTARFEDTTTAQLERLLQLNIRATVLLTRAVLPVMLRRNEGLILNVSSIAAFAPIPYKMIYPAAKAFLLSFTMGIQEEYRTTNICISTVHPGPIWTGFDAARRAMIQGWAGVRTTRKASTIARLSIDACLRGRRMIIPGSWNKIQFLLTRLLPVRLYLRWSGDMIKRELNNRQR